MKNIIFKDKLNLQDKDDKRTIISIRDGIHEYLGFELGMTPADKIFSVYRSPETVKEIAPKLINLPLSDEHLDFDKLPKYLEKGKILTSEVQEFEDKETVTTVNVLNKVFLDENMVQLVSEGKDELSLDYSGSLIPHDQYDFEQVDIVPKFLAIVSRGRCGSQCKFQDQKGEEMGLEEILKVIGELSEEDRLKLMDALLPKKLEDGEGEKSIEDQEVDKEKLKKEGVEEFKDSQCFQDAMINFADERVSVIEKAKGYLAKDYTFKGKSNLDIMRDSLKAEKSGVEFKDCEVGVAFKMLQEVKATDELKHFADKKEDSKWDKLLKGEI